jgi:cell wall-associated NlpC family hydrolase
MVASSAVKFGIDRRRVAQLLSQTSNAACAGDRIDALSRSFLGYPYMANPLIGSAHTAEEFTASLDGFDCVTYIETVLALSRARRVDDFADWLRKIRYEQGRIHWRRRNHYMTAWIRNNICNGILRRVSPGAAATVSRERVLNVVPGLAARKIRLRCVPKPALRRLYLQTGDLIFFASTRRNLDIFHCGIVIRDGQSVRLRHASRSRAMVVEQELSEFLKTNRMAGVIVVRPQEFNRATARITPSTARGISST